MVINFQAFLGSLPIMGKGMLGIFAVCLIIIGCVYLMSLIKPKNKDK